MKSFLSSYSSLLLFNLFWTQLNHHRYRCGTTVYGNIYRCKQGFQHIVKVMKALAASGCRWCAAKFRTGDVIGLTLCWAPDGAFCIDQNLTRIALGQHPSPYAISDQSTGTANTEPEEFHNKHSSFIPKQKYLAKNKTKKSKMMPTYKLACQIQLMPRWPH